jgi:hypothetical protein
MRAHIAETDEADVHGDTPPRSRIVMPDFMPGIHIFGVRA